MPNNSVLYMYLWSWKKAIVIKPWVDTKKAILVKS